MLTIKEHIYAIQNILNRGPKSDDARLSNSLVEHFLNVARSRVLKQKLNQLHHISSFNYQSFCLELEEVKYSDCSCIPAKAKCKVLRSKVKIPQSLNYRHNNGIIVQTIDGHSIPNSKPSSNHLAKYSLSKANTKPHYFIENGYLYILNNLNLKQVKVKMISVNPRDLSSFTDCYTANSCYSANSPYPIDQELVDSVYRLTIELLNISNSIPEDKVNNSSDDRQMQPTN